MNALWNLAGELIGEKMSVSPEMIERILILARERSIHYSESDALGLISRFQGKQGYFSVPVPERIISFINDYTHGMPIQTALDPSSELGSLIAPIAHKHSTSQFFALNQQPMSLAPLIYEVPNVQWLRADAFNWLESNEQSYDLIVSNLLFGMREFPRDQIQVKTDIHDTQEHLLILKACQRLTENGVGIFIVINNFLSRDRGVRQNLAKFDLHLDAVLYLASGIFAPTTSIPANIIIIKRTPSDRLFVAELTAKIGRNIGVRRLLKKRQETDSLGMGALVDEATFTTYDAYRIGKQIEQESKRLGLEQTRLGDIAITITPFTRSSRNKLAHGVIEYQPNAIYVPKLNASQVLKTPPPSESKQDYFIVVLDADQALDDYVLRFLNSPLGKANRNALSQSLFTPWIMRKEINELIIYLPTLEVQRRLVEVDTQATRLMNDIQELQSQLWTNLTVDESALQKLPALSGNQALQDDRFIDWINTLPFPLASILWAYYATNDDFKKYRLLIRYFEALTQFYAIVLLSGLYNDKEWFMQLRDALHVGDEFTLLRPTFGSWKNIIDKATKIIRSQLESAKSSTEVQTRLEQIFSLRIDVLDALLPTNLLKTFRETNDLRNIWRGHGGIDDKVATQRLQELETHLETTRSQMGKNWGRFQLIKPESSRKQGQIVHQNVQYLQGHTNPFRMASIVLEESLSASDLYLYQTGQITALKVQPLMYLVIGLVGEEQAAYFYSKLTKGEGKAIFISHHHETEPDIIDVFPETIQAIRDIQKRLANDSEYDN